MSKDEVEAKTEQYYHKLKPLHKDLILQYFAVNETPTNIVNILRQKYSINIKLHSITYYRDKYPEKILAYQEKLKRDFSVIPSANKYWRLYTRHKLILDLLDHLWVEVPVMNTRTGEIIRDKDGEIVFKTLLKGNHGVINVLLDSQAKELEEYDIEDDTKTDLFKRLLDRGDVAINFIMSNSGNGRNGDETATN